MKSLLHAIWLLLPMNRSSACLSLVSALLPLVVARFFRLAQQIPMKFAMELLLVAEPISAQKANEWGLVNYVVLMIRWSIRPLTGKEDRARCSSFHQIQQKKTVIESFGSNFIYPSPGWGSARRIREDHARERRRPRRRGRIRRKAQACLDGSLTDERQPMSHEQSVPHIHSNENEGRSHDRSSSLEDATLTRASKLIPPCVISVIDCLNPQVTRLGWLAASCATSCSNTRFTISISPLLLPGNR